VVRISGATSLLVSILYLENFRQIQNGLPLSGFSLVCSPAAAGRNWGKVWGMLFGWTHVRPASSISIRWARKYDENFSDQNIQYFMRVDDDVTGSMLRYFTFLTLEEITELMKEHQVRELYLA
jgi:hypothetical protein